MLIGLAYAYAECRAIATLLILLGKVCDKLKQVKGTDFF